MANWTSTDVLLPPDGIEVEVLNGGIETTLVRDGRLWWFPDRSMYVYYVPRFWRHL